jgi:hypothetical protein
MKITLKNVKTFQGREGSGLNADIYLDGVKIAHVHDQGNGGEYFYDVFDRDKYKALTDHLATLPDHIYPASEGSESFSVKMDLGILVDQAFEEFQKEKFKKGMEKKMVNNIVLGVPGADTYACVKLKFKAAQYPKEQLQKIVDSVKEKHLMGREQILNTNLEYLGVKI